jgi:hypothetical protein
VTPAEQKAQRQREADAQAAKNDSRVPPPPSEQGNATQAHPDPTRGDIQRNDPNNPLAQDQRQNERQNAGLAQSGMRVDEPAYHDGAAPPASAYPPGDPRNATQAGRQVHGTAAPYHPRIGDRVIFHADPETFNHHHGVNGKVTVTEFPAQVLKVNPDGTLRLAVTTMFAVHKLIPSAAEWTNPAHPPEVGFWTWPPRA